MNIEEKINIINNCNSDYLLRKYYDNESKITILRAFTKNIKTPSDILYKISLLTKNDQEASIAIAKHPNTNKGTLLNNLFEINNLEIKFTIYNRSDLKTEIIEKLKEYKIIFSKLNKNEKNFISVIKGVILESTLSDETLEKLSKDIIYNVQLAVLEHSNASIKLKKEVFQKLKKIKKLDKIFKSKNTSFLKEMARCPNIPSEILEEVFNENKNDFSIMIILASNLNIDSETLNNLFELNDLEIKFIIYNRDNLPNSIISKLKEYNTIFSKLNKNETDFIGLIKGIILESTLSHETLEKLSKDIIYNVQFAVLEHSNTSIKLKKEIFQKLKKDKSLDKTLGNKNTSFLKEVAMFSETPKEILEEVYNDNKDDSSIMKILASNPNTSTETLEKLSVDNDYDVREVVASNPNTPTETLNTLLGDEDEVVRNIAQKNLNNRLGINQEDSTTPEEILEEDMPRNYYIYKNFENIKEELKENDYLLQMDTDNSIINSYKYENSELINLKDGVINKIGKEFIKNYFYQHKDILNFEENLLPITRGQFFYLQELLTREEKEIKSDYQLTDPENIIFYGPPGTGKTYGFRKKAMNIIYGKNNIEDIYEEYKELVKTDRINFTTFHPDYSYEAFIEGIKPRTTTEDNVIYEIESGAFLKTCENALVKGLYSDELKDEFNKLKLSNKNIFDFFLEQNSDTQKNMYKKAGNFVFIIDEINRGNLPRIFGELITLMEADKRLGAEEQITLKLPYSQKTFSIPKNVHILGSMNTADKSIASIDTALRRRFKFIEVMPNITLLEDVEIEGIEVNELLRRINENIEKYHDREHTIGHAYFMKLIKNPSFDLLCDIMEFQVIPLLQEYFHEDWGKVKLVLNNSELIKELIDKDTKNNKENNDIWKEKEKKIYKVNDSLKNRNESELIKLFKDICK